MPTRNDYPMRALAVDPGGMTGLAWYDDAPFFRSTETATYEETVRSVTDVLHNDKPDVLICEAFLIRSNTHKLDAGSFNQTTDLIGACRLLCWQFDTEFVRQTPAEAKSFADDAKLRRLGWYSVTPGGHANDATRHLLTYLAKQRYVPVLEGLTDAD